jgi:hypothetical protein
MDRDGYCHYAPWFFTWVWTMTGIAKFSKLWPVIYYRWFLCRDGGPWWVLPLCPMILYMILDCDGYCQVLQVWPVIYYRWLLCRDGYCHCTPWFFMWFWTVMGIAKFYKLWPMIYYHWFLDRDGYCHYTLWFFILFPIVIGIPLYM